MTSEIRPTVTVGSSDHGDHIKEDIFTTAATRTPSAVLVGLALVVLAFAGVFIVIGAMNIQNCKLQPMIPIWLLVMGILMIFAVILGGIVMRRKKTNPYASFPTYLAILGLIAVLLMAAWFVAGNVWVYVGWSLEPDYGHFWFSNACDKSTFILAFIAVIIMDALFGIAIIAVLFGFVSKQFED